MIKFNNNTIGDEGAKAIAEALKVNLSLKELWISENKICAEGVKAIAEALKINYSLEILNLEDN